MSEEFNDLRDELCRSTFVCDVKLQSSTELGFDLTGVAGVITITLVLQSFLSTIGTKSAEGSWNLVGKFFDHLRKKLRSRPRADASPPFVNVSYVAPVRSVNVEMVLSYRTFSDLQNDLRHHQQYVAIGLGYLQAELPPAKRGISLKHALPEERQAVLADFQLRRAKAAA